MAHSSWGPGWPNCSTSKIVTLVTDSGVRLPVRAELATLTSRLVKDLETKRGRKFNPAWCWGFACRAISGTTSPSNHSWGLASDLDAPENPYMSAADHAAPHPLRKRFRNGKLLRSTMPLNASKIAAKYGFRWGGDYATKPDPMHFEFTGSVADAARLTRETRPVPTWTIVARKVTTTTAKGWEATKRRTAKLRERGYRIVKRERRD